MSVQLNDRLSKSVRLKGTWTTDDHSDRVPLCAADMDMGPIFVTQPNPTHR